MKIFTSRSIVILFLCLAAMSMSSSAGAQTVPFKVYITALWQLDTNVDPVIGVIGDYYAIVTINGVQMSNKQGSDGACNDETSTGILVPFQLFNYFNAIPSAVSPPHGSSPPKCQRANRFTSTSIFLTPI
jgi:hypothetical protein